MTVKLTGNFLATARCLIFEDGNGITWEFDPTTNELTANSSGSSANTAANLSGGLAGDIPYQTGVGATSFIAAGTNGYVLTMVGGTPAWAAASGGGSGANPTATIGLTAVNGSATTFLRSDGAPALGVGISPTWTGAHTFTPSTAVTAITVNGNASATYGFVFNGADNQWSGLIQGNTTTGQSYGLLMQAGTNASDYCFDFTNAAGSTNILRGYGEGSIVAGAATGANKGAGTINVSGGYYVNGTAILAGSSGTFTGTLTGCATSPTGTCAYAIAGNVCTLFVASITGTSNTTAMTITGLPSAAQPTRTQLLMPPLDACENGGAVVGTISMSVAASGTITFLLGNSTTGFGNTLVKGVATGFTVSYLLN